MRDDRVYLRHILECVDAIASYAAEGRAAFLAGLSLPGVWDVVERDLPAFRVAVMAMLEELGGPKPPSC